MTVIPTHLLKPYLVRKSFLLKASSCSESFGWDFELEENTDHNESLKSAASGGAAKVNAEV